MTLQQIFIVNLKKFRKKRGVSQMTLAELCDSSGNYIGEIEMGRRIPSFEKIEKIASALKIPPHQLFVQESNESNESNEEQEPKTKDFLDTMPFNVKKEIASRLLSGIHHSIEDSFNAKNY